jgi:hypothetical protein
MARLDGTPRKRLQIADGILVASTNQRQYSCIKAFKDKIIHRYRCRNYKRISRFVQHSNIEENGNNVKEK